MKKTALFMHWSLLYFPIKILCS